MSVCNIAWYVALCVWTGMYWHTSLCLLSPVLAEFEAGLRVLSGLTGGCVGGRGVPVRVGVGVPALPRGLHSRHVHCHQGAAPHLPLLPSLSSPPQRPHHQGKLRPQLHAVCLAHSSCLGRWSVTQPSAAALQECDLVHQHICGASLMHHEDTIVCPPVHVMQHELDIKLDLQTV